MSLTPSRYQWNPTEPEHSDHHNTSNAQNGSQASERQVTNPSVLQNIKAGSPFGLLFGGQGSPVHTRLQELLGTYRSSVNADELWRQALQHIAPARTFVDQWFGIDLEAPEPLLNASETLGHPAVDSTAITFAQLLELRALKVNGLETDAHAPAFVIGHSQGLIAASAAQTQLTDSEALALAIVKGAAVTRFCKLNALPFDADRRPMVSVAGLSGDELSALITEFNASASPASADSNSAAPNQRIKFLPELGVTNSDRRHVITGHPHYVDACVRFIDGRRDDLDFVANRKRAITFDPLGIGAPFHHRDLDSVITDIFDLAITCWVGAYHSLDESALHDLIRNVVLAPLDWPQTIQAALPEGEAGWLINLGPGTDVAQLTKPLLLGTNWTLCSHAPTSGKSTLLTPGAAPTPNFTYEQFAPAVIELPDGALALETKLTRTTGYSPFILAGMTPTTADAPIVAAAANAGHWAELAGGGQVTSDILKKRLQELNELLDDGVQVQFNAMFLDPYLWGLHLGSDGVLFDEIRKNAPISGVTISAGIPELEEAVELIAKLRDHHVEHIAFKPGTVDGIKQVVAIAEEVSPIDLVIQVEGGLAGGHHSWEDLDELLLNTYDAIRRCSNLTLVVGGGIGTPEDAAEYLIGTWASRHGRPNMPVDGILVGTAAMATLEATTSQQVKALLAQTPGHDSWVGTETTAGGITSGRSQLGADLHEIENSASQTARLLDEVAGDGDAVAARRGEIIEALNKTAKPFFGDLDSMTYLAMLQRFVELCAIGRNGRYEDGAWLDRSWRTRFIDLLHRSEARLADIEEGEITSLFPTVDSVDDPQTALEQFTTAYPLSETALIHPFDIAYFVQICDQPGKPVPFVPVIDSEVRRRWRSDSLWYAHDDRFSADEVIAIPGPAAVRGITTVDEPVAELLQRFETGVVEIAQTANAAAVDTRDHRRVRHVNQCNLPYLIAQVLSEPFVTWNGQRRANPALAVAPRERWSLVDDESAETPCGLARLRITGNRSVGFDLLELPGTTIELHLLDAAQPGLVVTRADASHYSSQLRSIAQDAPCAEVLDRPAFGAIAVRLDLSLLREHAAFFGAESTLADALVGPSWPAIFELLQASHDEVDGFSDLVHLDHQLSFATAPAWLTAEDTPTHVDLHVTASRVATRNTAVGTVHDVNVEITHDGMLIGTLVERFLIQNGFGHDKMVAAQPVIDHDSITPTAQRTLLASTVMTPSSAAGMSSLSGDHNPLHASTVVARLAGFPDPIVHGMWISSAMQHAAAEAVGADTTNGIAVKQWQVQFLAPVQYNSTVDIRVARTGRSNGNVIVDITATVNGELCAHATAVVAPPRTVYAFPGQGIQHVGMGQDALGRSAAAREVWQRADTHTSDHLGFSILDVVKNNPTELQVGNDTFMHPDGVLYLTQFTQVAMATLASAQIAELREAGAFDPNAITCGHSVGEYNALSAVTGILTLEEVLEVVYQRGLAMHRLVPRDAAGASRFSMAAVRPTEAGLSETELIDLVDRIYDELGCDPANETAEFIQIVNYNLRGGQYAIAGTRPALQQLQEVMEDLRDRRGGRGVFIMVPGIDVPFHSKVLHHGVADFRSRLDAVLPVEVDPALLVGRYIPNLVPRPFSLEHAFVSEVANTVPSELLAEVLSEWDTWEATPGQLCRAVLLELLAWQFASPVRWIETQDLLFLSPAQGGLGVGEFIEVGVGAQPTLTSLAKNTLRDLVILGAAPSVMNLELDRAVLFGEDEDPVDDAADDADSEPTSPAASDSAGESASSGATTPATTPAPTSPPTAAPVSAPAATPRAQSKVADIHWRAEQALTHMLSVWTKNRPDQISSSDTIESLVEGVSSRRNQLLMDLGKEFGVGPIDGAGELPISELINTLATRVQSYRTPGQVLRTSIEEQLRVLTGPAKSRPAAIADRVHTHWGLGDGWAIRVGAHLALATRTGASVRGGDLATIDASELRSADDLARLIDESVQAVAQLEGVTVAPQSTASDQGAVDPQAAAVLLDKVLGDNGVLADVAGTIHDHMATSRNGTSVEAATTSGLDSDAADTLAQLEEHLRTELDAQWLEKTTPVFQPESAVLFDDAWAHQRFVVAQIAQSYSQSAIDELASQLHGPLDPVAYQHATWWATHSEFTVARTALEEIISRHEQLHTSGAAESVGQAAREVALVTGASPNSIAADVVGTLLEQGATVIATSSHNKEERVDFFRDLYRSRARLGAELWFVPANMASYRDINALIEWCSTTTNTVVGGEPPLKKPVLTPTVLYPFAAAPSRGELVDVGPEAELDMRVLLWSVERMIAGLVEQPQRNTQSLHVVLPGSPNRGSFGGDGIYGEAKAAFDALFERAQHESWGKNVTMSHAIIGWVRGTGLMAQNDVLVPLIEEHGIETWSQPDMATALVALTLDRRNAAADTQVPTHEVVDLSRGLWNADIDISDLARQASEQARSTKPDSDQNDTENVSAETLLPALPQPPVMADLSLTAHEIASWGNVTTPLSDMVAIIGLGEVGPYGSARTRFEVEVSDRLSTAAVAELAWMCGLIRWDDSPQPGFYDTDSGEFVPEHELVTRYEEQLRQHSGIRVLEDDANMADHKIDLMASVFLEKDLEFIVNSREEADAFLEFDPTRCTVTDLGDGTFKVRRAAGTEIRVPRHVELPRTVGAQLPAGFDPAVYGIPADMISSLDRVAVWNLVATVDAFLDAGIEPADLLQVVHPTRVANTQGTGIGGISAIRSLYVDGLLGNDRPNDILQEALPNVIAAHVMQSYVGGYGAMVHPVAACATAAISVEEAFDKIRLGRADVVVAGGFDDFGPEGLVGFADMNATASSDAMAKAGISPRRMSRANDRRRAGFVEGQGGGTILLARGDLAVQMGLPIRGLVAWAGSHSDGINVSIPAPGVGLVGAGYGGSSSPLARELAGLGVVANDIAVVSKHDTSTQANDPNESLIHERLADQLGRDANAPLFVVSQKSVTGHAKGGAAAFQIAGLCQILESGVVPGNRSLDCVDDILSDHERLVWPTAPLQIAGPVKAGLVTSLGFGHVGALVAIVHPHALLAALSEEDRECYLQLAQVRLLHSKRRRLHTMAGGAPLFVKQKDPFAADDARHQQELAMLMTTPTAGAAGSDRGARWRDEVEVES